MPRAASQTHEVRNCTSTATFTSQSLLHAGLRVPAAARNAQRVADIIGEITAASGEQSSGVGQVNTAVNHLDQMTQQNAALVEQSTAAAHSLQDQAQRLTQAVQVFRTA